MADFTAKDVQSLRQITGAGMMDAKKALTENDGDFEAAKQWLREKGLGKVEKLGDRDNSQGSVTAVVDGQIGAIVQLKSETDFSAKADDFTSLVQDLAELVVAKGTDAVAELADEIDTLKTAISDSLTSNSESTSHPRLVLELRLSMATSGFLQQPISVLSLSAEQVRQR